MDVSSCLHLNRLESSDVSFWIVCIRKELNTVVVLSGGTDTSFQSVLNSDVCNRKELNADVVLSGGTDISLQAVMKYDVCIRKELNADVVLARTILSRES